MTTDTSTIDTPQGHKRQPLDGSPHARCECCALWFPADALEYYLGKDRCPSCGNAARQGGAGEQPDLIP